MIHIFGDSHGVCSFQNMPDVSNHSKPAVTMHRIGRDDEAFYDFNTSQRITSAPVAVFVFGEIDCRCHIKRQVLLERSYKEVINTLVNKYLTSIKSNKPKDNRKIIVCGVIPPTYLQKLESVHGSCQHHEYPIIGLDEERLTYCKELNMQLENKCKELGFIYADVYHEFTDDTGMLDFELSDTTVHVGSSQPCVEILMKLTT